MGVSASTPTPYVLDPPSRENPRNLQVTTTSRPELQGSGGCDAGPLRLVMAADLSQA